MCGRYFLLASDPTFGELFNVGGFADLAPRYNISPTQTVVAVRVVAAADADQKAGRELARLRWGLIPAWAKDAKLAPINARSETAADKPMFRHALRKKRCLLPASGFYEWKARGGKRKQPYCFRLADYAPFAFAGLWDRWHGPEGDVDSCCILTTSANDLVAPIHDRMPVILGRQHYERWLDPAEQDAQALEPLLRPYLAEWMRAYPVGPAVSSPRNDSPACIEPAA